MNAELRKAKNLSDKHLMLFLLMNEWVKIKQMGRSVEDYLIKRGYGKVAIYGMSYAGQRLYDELIDTDVEIISCMDKKDGGTYRNHKVRSAENIPDTANAVIVTPILYFDEIKNDLENKTKADIVSLEEVIYGISGSDE